MPPRQNNLKNRVRRFQQFEDEKVPEMLRTIEGFVKSRNTFTESEFAHFQPYYQKNTPAELRKALEKELGERTSPFEPIRIVADHGDADGNHEILMTLPARLAPTNPINNRVGNSTQLVDTFSNKVENPNPLNTDAEAATDRLMSAVSKTIRDDNGRAKNAKLVLEAEQKIAKAKGKKLVPKQESITDKAAASEDSIDDFDLESLGSDNDQDDDFDFAARDDDNDDTSLEDMDYDE